MISKVMTFALLGLLIALRNADDLELVKVNNDIQFSQVTVGIDAGLSTIKTDYFHFENTNIQATLQEAQETMTCKKGYAICCAVSNNNCGCFKFESSFKSHFILEKSDNAYFGAKKYGDIELKCKEAKYTVDPELSSLLFHQPTFQEELEKVPKPKYTGSYCGIIGNDLQKQQQFIRFFALGFSRPTLLIFENPQQLNGKINYTYIFCGSKDQVKDAIQRESQKVSKENKNLKSIFVRVLFIIVIIGVVAGFLFWFHGRDEEVENYDAIEVGNYDAMSNDENAAPGP